jgi:hypothetical protein
MPCIPWPLRSMFVLMVETLGEAYRLGWRATAYCIWSGPNPKSPRPHAYGVRHHGRPRHEDADLDAWGELSAQAP